MQARSSDHNYVCLSAHPSVRLSNASIVTKRKKHHSKFYTILYQFMKKRMVDGGPLLPEIFR